jgi:two-component system, cell cycle sensor histidine kinase and response regulator CckA
MHKPVVLDQGAVVQDNPGGMGGREAIDHLLAINPKVRVILSSGYSSDPILSNFAQHGFRAVVNKPYQISELAAALQAALK